jgi:hypothetical protein
MSSALWTVVMVCREGPRYWLFTREAYSNFVLRLEYRSPSKPRQNTGSAVLLRMAQAGPHDDVHLRVHFGGWATGRVVRPFTVLPQMPEGYRPLPGVQEAERRAGEWNQLQVTCVYGAAVVRLNGVLVNFQQHCRRGRAGSVWHRKAAPSISAK